MKRKDLRIKELYENLGVWGSTSPPLFTWNNSLLNISKQNCLSSNSLPTEEQQIPCAYVFQGQDLKGERDNIVKELEKPSILTGCQPCHCISIIKQTKQINDP